MNTLRREIDVVEQPRFIQRLYINVEKHNFAINTLKDKVNTLEAYYYEDKRAIRYAIFTNRDDQNSDRTKVIQVFHYFRCGGVVLENLLFANVPLRKRPALGLKTLQFVPYFRSDVIDVSNKKIENLLNDEKQIYYLTYLNHFTGINSLAYNVTNNRRKQEQHHDFIGID